MKYTDTMYFPAFKNIPGNILKDVTYGLIVVDFRPQKNDPYLTRYYNQRQPNQISREGHKTNSRYDNGKTIGLHYNFNPRGMIHVL